MNTETLTYTGTRTAGFPGHRIVAIVPCYNEEVAIGKVVTDLIAAVPAMEVYVYDNNSSDNTAEVARAAGAIVRTERLKGKGNVVRRAFADLDADVYLLIDGDDTYDASAAPRMIQALLDGPHDHVLGIREPVVDAATAYREGHERGNRILNQVVAGVFGENVEDMLSGYRVFSRRFVKSFPAASREFEIETELTVHCLTLRTPATSMKVGFKDRPAGSESKLRTYHDGFRILRLIVNLARHERPVAFYGALAVLCALGGAVAATPFVQGLAGLAGYGSNIALAAGLMSALLLTIGVVMDGLRKNRHESSRLSYLAHPAVRQAHEVREPSFGVREILEAAPVTTLHPVRYLVGERAYGRA